MAHLPKTDVKANMKKDAPREICPYCGNGYGSRTMCCQEPRSHAVWIWNGTEYDSEHDALIARRESKFWIEEEGR